MIFRLCLIAFAVCAAHAEPAQGERGAVATGRALATEAALAAMQRGGNAVDAAVAAGLTLGVVDGSNSGIGGSCFLLLRTAAGEYVAIDGRETAPRAIVPEMFLRDGQADTQLSQTGALAVATPGALAAYDLALRAHGKLPLAEHLRTAAEIAEHGFPLDRETAKRIASEADDLRRFPASRAVFLPEDQPLAEGATLVQRDLAQTYRAIAEHGIAWFYEGPFAEAVAQWMRENGGVLATEDFRAYRPIRREPVRGTYRGHDIVSFPPPSSGGVHLLQILNLIEGHDLRALGAGSVDTIHVLTEAMKLAFADRAHWLGDPDFVPVPRGLIAKDYAARLAPRIRMDAASAVPSHDTPDHATDDIFRKHTTHFSAADAEGNWVACTATLNTAFGSKVIVPGTGVLLNNQMDDFALAPGVPNAFGLLGGEANAVAPGKRPLSSMTPTIVAKDGQPLLAVGAAGGPTIITQTLLAIVNTIDFDLDVGAALAAPRFHHQWRPDELRIETSVPEPIRAELAKRGHKLEEKSAFGAAQAVAREGTAFRAAADPRNAGTAAGW